MLGNGDGQSAEQEAGGEAELQVVRATDWRHMLEAAWPNPHFGPADLASFGSIYKWEGQFLMVTAVHGAIHDSEGEGAQSCVNHTRSP